MYKLIRIDIHTGETLYNEILHSKNCGVKITPPVYIEDHTMHFTPVLNLWYKFNTQWCYSNTFGCYFNTLWCYVQTLGCNFNT